MIGGMFAYQVGSVLALTLMSHTTLLSSVYLKSIGAFVLSTCVIGFFWKEIPKLWKGTKTKYVIGLLVFSAIDSIGWMGSMYYNGLIGSAILAKMIPLCLVMYGVIFLKESLTRYQIMAGILMILASLSFSVHAVETQSVMGLVAHAVLVFGYCGFAIMMKHLSDEYSPYGLMWARLGVVCLIVLPLTPFVADELTAFDLEFLLYLLGLGAVFGFLNGFVKHSLTMKAYSLAPMSFLAFVNEFGMPLSFLTGFFFLGENMSTAKWAATILAFGAMAVLLIEQWRKRIV